MDASSTLPPKASRSYSKRSTAFNLVACWLAIAASIAAGREMAAIVVPVMATLIAALTGVYQAIGHFDLRALAALAGRPEPARTRKKPEGAS